jgi:large subunit ribosomal protein L16
MLQPSKTKFRKAHKGRIRGLATSAKDLAFGQYGLKATEPERVTARRPGLVPRLSGRTGVEEAA